MHMIIKLIGALFVVGSCGAVGFKIAFNYKQEERALRQLMGILEYMSCELQYRLTPLPLLCRQIARSFKQTPASVFLLLAKEMELQREPDLSRCVRNVVNRSKALPPETGKILLELGTTLGRFDLEGQLKGLEAVKNSCKYKLDILEKDADVRNRSYQTLGLCAGAALAILFV